VVQLTVWGVPVLPADARHLVATLIADGSPDRLAAAAAIDRKLNDRGGLVGSTPNYRRGIPVSPADADDPAALLAVIDRQTERNAFTRPSSGRGAGSAPRHRAGEMLRVGRGPVFRRTSPSAFDTASSGRSRPSA
jgi:hypothetical protein